MRHIRYFLTLACLLTLLCVQVPAAPITTLFNTGVDALGSPRPDGTIGDLHYSLISVHAPFTSVIRIRTSAGGFPIPPYLGDNAFSAWIGPNNDMALNGPAGTYVYRTTFDLTGFNPGTASITGGWSTDNNGLDIRINGVSLGFTTAANQFEIGFAPFTVNSNFVAGINTLDFLVNNSGGPTALRVELVGSANSSAVPEPASIVLVAVGIAGLRISRRSQKRA